MQANKTTLRKQLLARRLAITETERSLREEQISSYVLRVISRLEQVATLERVAANGSGLTIGLYSAFRGEVDISAVQREAWRRGWSVAFPKAQPVSKTLDFYRVTADDAWTVGAYGIREPVARPESLVSPDELGAICVPGVAFDRHGVRLGYGGGYYDRWCSRHGGILRLGIAYSEQFLEDLPSEPHDVRMDYIITERGVWVCDTPS